MRREKQADTKFSAAMFTFVNHKTNTSFIFKLKWRKLCNRNYLKEAHVF